MCLFMPRQVTWKKWNKTATGKIHGKTVYETVYGVPVVIIKDVTENSFAWLKINFFKQGTTKTQQNHCFSVIWVTEFCLKGHHYERHTIWAWALSSSSHLVHIVHKFLKNLLRSPFIKYQSFFIILNLKISNFTLKWPDCVFLEFKYYTVSTCKGLLLEFNLKKVNIHIF